MNKGFFKKGFGAVEEYNKEKERREKERKEQSGKLWQFILKEEDGAVPIRFLTHEPFSYPEHTWKTSDGKWHSAPCEGDNCQYCEDDIKTRQVGVFLVVDGRPYESKVYDEDGNDTGKKKQHPFSIKLLVRGMKDMTRISTLATRKGGLSENVFLVERQGTGVNTTYQYDKDNELDTDNPVFQSGALTEEAIEMIYAELPEKYQDCDFEEILVKQYIKEDSNASDEEVEEPREIKTSNVKRAGRVAARPVHRN